MGREIKFRAYDIKKKAFIKDFTIYPDGKLVGVNHAYGNIKLMQYTGLKDKNDVEIYEGDVVKPIKGMDGEHGEVWWQPAISAFVIDWSRAKNVGKCDHQLNSNRELEVIGNIYEDNDALQTP